MSKRRCAACLMASRMVDMVRFGLVLIATGVVGFLALFAVRTGSFLVECRKIIQEAGWAGLAEMPV